MSTTISSGTDTPLGRFHARDRRPLYQQLAEGIAAHIRNGALPLGSRLPPLRALAKSHAVALVTASQAYEALAAEGLIESRSGRGTYVSFDADASEPAMTAQTPRASDAAPEQRSQDQWDSALSRYSAQTRRVAAMHLLRSSFRPGTIALSNGHTAPR